MAQTNISKGILYIGYEKVFILRVDDKLMEQIIYWLCSW